MMNLTTTGARECPYCCDEECVCDDFAPEEAEDDEDLEE